MCRQFCLTFIYYYLLFVQDLRQFLDFAFVGTLSRDSSNIIDLIQHTYAVIKFTEILSLF